MPFAVWCHGCAPHALIAQGVRFNAAKRRVGAYHSTPIWSFRLRHPACGAAIEIRTDPAHTAYVVVEGGRARDYGEEKREGEEAEGGGGGTVPALLTPAERERRREDAFAQLEGRVEEAARAKDTGKRIRELHAARARDWDDPWAANRRVRSSFRQERKARKREEAADEALKSRLGTDMQLLPEAAEDAVRAKLVGFGDGSLDGPGVDDVGSRPLFRPQELKRAASGTNAISRAATPARRPRKEALRQQLLSSTRAAMNPFG